MYASGMGIQRNGSNNSNYSKSIFKSNTTVSGDSSQKSEVESLLRTLTESAESTTAAKGTKTFTAQSMLNQTGLSSASQLGFTGDSDVDKALAAIKKLNYNYRTVSTMIQRAKNANSAGKAVIAAKRQVATLRSKLRSCDDEDESQEIQLAISHAQQMERVAKKKQHHLQQEELVESTMSLDEKEAAAEEAIDAAAENARGISDEDMKKAMEKQKGDSLNYDATNTAYQNEASLNASEYIPETDISEFPETDMSEFTDTEFAEEFSSDMEELMGEMEDLSDEMSEELSDMMDMFEAVDPHMSKESLQKLKLKHRNSERKDIVKADMDYLKGVFDHLEAAGAPQGTTGTGDISAGSFVSLSL